MVESYRNAEVNNLCFFTISTYGDNSSYHAFSLQPKYKHMKTIAIIGASTGQQKLYVKAKEMGLRTIGFAWEKGAICKNLADIFYPISILEKDEILKICLDEKVNGIISNCSDLTAEVVSYLTSKMGLHGIPVDKFILMRDKSAMRSELKEIDELTSVWNYVYDGSFPPSLPCVVKPCTGASKKGVFFVNSFDEFPSAISYAKESTEGQILIEEYIEGKEVSVESISYEGQHYVVQITDKESTGAPHFVEIGHHQPSQLPQEITDKIKRIIPRILGKINFTNGASHTEIKITDDGRIYVIEVNPRGGGDEISNTLVELSTDFDYVKSMISVAIGEFDPPIVHNMKYAGIYYLCSQTQDKVEFFKKSDGKEWLIEKNIKNYNLSEGTSNYDRNGYLIYQSDKKITIYD